MTIIQVNNLRKDFKVYAHKKGLFGTIGNLFSSKHTVVEAVNNINFKVQRGEFVGYVGPNGAGKSTTIKMLTGILLPSSGHIEVNGIIPYKNRQENAKHIGVVFGQRSQLWWDLPPIDAFFLLGKVYKVEDSIIKKKIKYFNELLSLESFLHTPVRKLSLGQKMRCELTAAMLHSPEILFLDEPTIGLDIVAKDQIRNFLKEINQRENVTVILTTHDLDDIERLCKRIIIIDHGKIIHDGSLVHLKERFAKHKQVIIDFFEIDRLELPEGAKVVRRQENRFVIQIETDRIKTPQLINFILQNYNIHDLSIHETDIEDIIAHIYQQ